jgi:geranylgeranyl reductase family protein
MPQRWDVVVVGAGPAGSTAAARVLHDTPGARVLMLDRAEFPRDKPCGDGIAGEVVDLLDDLGLDGSAVVDGYRPAVRLRVRSPRDVVVDRRLRTPAFVIPRQVLDARLLDEVRRRGAEVLRHRVRALEVTGDRVVVDGRFHANVVVGADGAESTVRRAIGARPSPARSVAVAIRGYAPEPPDQPQTQLLTMSAHRWPAYAWSFPIGDGRANVGYGEPLHRGPVSRAELLRGLRRLLPDVEPDPGSLRAHRLPLSTGRPPVARGRILLAGDAQALINPLTGEGIFYAVLSGSLAGAAARHGAGAGTAYRRALRRHLGRYLRHTGLLARASRWPSLMDAAVAAAAQDQGAFDDVVDLGLVTGPLTPRLAARTLWELTRTR